MKNVEIWKAVKGYEGRYFVSNFGNIVNADGMPLKQETTQKGYKRVRLWKDGEVQNVKVHRIVAETFIPNPYNLPQVNHIDENKGNNHVGNLCWVDNRTNNRLRSVKPMRKRPVEIVDGKGNVVASFCSVTMASKITGVERFGITGACEGNQHLAGGYRWRYQSFNPVV